MAIGKRLKKAREGVDREKLYPLADAIKMVKERAKSKFDETIEIAMNLGVDPRHADQMVRGVVTLPNGTGRTLRVGVFARGAKAEEAKAAGADVVGAEDLVEKVQGGTIDFDRCIATPDMMPLVGRLGKVLGPRGMMPNPKIGTVTMDITNAVKGAKGGSVEFRVEKAGIVQAGIGKASFSEEKLVQICTSFSSENDALPMPACTMPAFSTRNSTEPPLAPFTALVMSMVTVPTFGFGIMPRGPSTLPRRPTSGIMSGVAIQRSKSILPAFTFSTRSSAPTTSAPAAFASSALAPRANTATRWVRPVPLGSATTPRTIWSA